MYYNWYDPRNGSVVTVWPDNGDTVYPFLSSVDNGWLAAALNVVKGAVPELRGKADAILRKMNFGSYYNPTATTPFGASGLIAGGFWDAPPPGCSRPRDGVWFTCNHYDITVTEPRIATYLGIAMGQIPPKAYYNTMRTLPATCDWSWHEMQPVGFDTTYEGVAVYVPVPRHPVRTQLGWRHVRGPDARPVRARSEVGAQQLGPQPSRDGRRPDRARDE
jgi:hypothetical protein